MPSVSGTAVTFTAVGLVVAYSGVRGIGVGAAARNLIGGKPPSQDVPQIDAIVSGINNASAGGDISGGIGATSGIVAAASQYVGVVPYNWAHANPTDGWDCSGMVNWVLGHDLGMTLPGGLRGFTGKWHGPVASMYKVWGKAKTIPREQASAGDLACWMTHIGICVDSRSMINAYDRGTITRVGGIEQDGPRGESLTIRRIM